MRIAQVAPLYESVPPKFYGGTERVVSYLTEELVALGHDVTLFASGDSLTKARLAPVCERSLRLDPECIDQLAHHILMLEMVAQAASELDIIHFHIDYLHYPYSRRCLFPPHVTTLHGRLDIPDLVGLYREYRDMPVVSISNAQRAPIPGANWVGTVYHGLPADLYRFYGEPGKYLAFLGRISPEKRVDRAIRIARQAGIPLKIAAKVDKVDREYYQQVILPLLGEGNTEYLGEIGEGEKNEFLGNACALLFPIDWPEPFGLVMIEALACGTPVIGCSRGSIPELLQDGVAGRIVGNAEEANQAVRDIPSFNRRHCREFFEERFTANRMARDYLKVYDALIQSGKAKNEETLSGNYTDRKSVLYPCNISTGG